MKGQRSLIDLGSIVFKEKRGLDSTIRFSWRMVLEGVFHLAYWVFHFTSVNTQWEADWTDHTAREVAQVTVLLFPITFYLNAFFLIPHYLKGNQWGRYFSVTVLLLLMMEVLRSLMFVLHNTVDHSFELAFFQEFTSRDNLLFGIPNSLLFAFLFSMVYRFTRDWIVNQRNPEEVSSDFSVSGASTEDALKYRQTLQAKRRDSTFLLQVEDIAFLQSKGDFVMATDKDGQTYTLNQTLAALETQLDPMTFFRINRSEMVNGKAILKFSNHTKNRLAITLKNPDEVLYTSNSRSPEFRKWLESMA